MNAMARHGCLAALVITAVALAGAQEINIAIGLGGRPPRVTIFDQIDDREERSAFRAMWDTSEPARQLTLATRFVSQFPRSVLLREAYELAARACVATGDLAQGLEWAKRSLRLMPENPFLLVMIADVAAKLNDFDLAAASARSALDYLEHAEPPSPITDAEWPAARTRLKATALFVVGRVAAHREQYKQAEQSLVASLTLNPDDMEALYTIAVVRMAVRADDGAARAFAHVARSATSLSAPARDSLRVLYERSGRSATASFDQWMASLNWNRPEPAPPVVEANHTGGYAGSASCRECHSSVYDQWRATGMANMLRPYAPGAIFGDFSQAHGAPDGARPIVEGAKHFIEIRNGDTQSWTRYPVDYVIGSKWQQAYATRLADERLLVFPIQYSRLRSAWVNYWSLVDAPGSPRTNISRFHDVPPDAVYQNSCAPCHTSQLSFPKQAANPSAATFREGGINCEMCHGPSREHVERLKGRTAGTRTDVPLRFSELPAARYVAVCAQCHAQSAIHDAQPEGPVNFSAVGAAYRTYPMELPSNFSRQAFYRDGRHRATTFISESFARSACFRQGNATCGSCHNPHPPDARSNPTSLKFAADSDAMCLQCHTDLREDLQRHTRHPPETEASRCVSCHMPRIMEALLFQARTHEIDDIPDAEMTIRFGNADSPNACLGCHRDRETAWLRANLDAFRQRSAP